MCVKPHVATYKKCKPAVPVTPRGCLSRNQVSRSYINTITPHYHHIPNPSLSMAEAGNEYADPGGETTLTNANFSKLRSQRRPRSPSPSEARTLTQLSISQQEFASLKIILKETVNLFTQQQIQRKKSEKTKKILLVLVLLLTNCLTLVCSNYLTNLLTQCQCPGSLQHPSAKGPAHSSTTLPKARLDHRLDPAWITDGPNLQTANIEGPEEPTNQKDQDTDSPIEAIEAKITIWEPSKQPPRNNETIEESIWTD